MDKIKLPEVKDKQAVYLRDGREKPERRKGRRKPQ
jgi:hypothetical protein